MLAASLPASDEVFTVASGVETSHLELDDALIDVMGADVTVGFCIATANPVGQCGAKLVFADVDPLTYTSTPGARSVRSAPAVPMSSAR
jgi:dTDP-4-amino-4,6-dideoxygalactose transaminase